MVRQNGQDSQMSYVLLSPITGSAVAEVFDIEDALAARSNGWIVIPVANYLGRLNRLIRENDGQQPTASQLCTEFT